MKNVFVFFLIVHCLLLNSSKSLQTDRNISHYEVSKNLTVNRTPVVYRTTNYTNVSISDGILVPRLQGNKSAIVRPVLVEETLRVSSSHTCGLRNGTTGTHRRLRIMISSTAQYLSIIFNWLIYFNRVCSASSRGLIYFLCLDKATEDAMKGHGLYCSHVSNGVSHSRLWAMRVRLTKQLLDQGYDVLLSDADAIWLRNPFEVLETFPNSDVIGSRASYPPEAYKQLGATVCMGFIYIKSTHGSKVLWGELVTAVGKMKSVDDQKAINYLFKDYGLLFVPKASYPGDGGPANTGTIQLKQYAATVAVTLLPHKQFRRFCEGVKHKTVLNSIVAHCLSQKTGSSKEKGEKRHGLWTIRDDWRNITFNNKVDIIDEFLEKIDVKAINAIDFSSDSSNEESKDA